MGRDDWTSLRTRDDHQKRAKGRKLSPFSHGRRAVEFEAFAAVKLDYCSNFNHAFQQPP